MLVQDIAGAKLNHGSYRNMTVLAVMLLCPEHVSGFNRFKISLDVVYI